MKTCPQCSTGYPESLTTCPTHGLPLNEIRDLKPGMIIRNTYRIIRKLGQGGMGAVYLAQHTLMNEPQALKFLSSELSHDEAFTARFLREVRTLRQIRHKNVVDAGNLEPAEDGTLFFSMEFVDGPDLRTFLNDARFHSAEKLSLEEMCQGTASAVPKMQQKEARALAPAGSGNTEGGGGFNPRIKPTESTRAGRDGFQPIHLSPAGSLPVPLALSIARQIAEGLGAAHSKGMVHRDIKPENILMARDAGAWLPKIADFGIVATKESSTAYTRTGGTLLTMAYAAPEQWRGLPAAQLDGRTDLYALGGLLYEMLTGQTPFHAENYEGWARQHQTTPPPPPSSLRPDLANWQSLDAIVLRLLAKDRNDRPKDVAELVGLIDAVQYITPVIRRETVREVAVGAVQKPTDEVIVPGTRTETESSSQDAANAEVKEEAKGWFWIPLIVAVVFGGIIFWVTYFSNQSMQPSVPLDSAVQTQPIVQQQPGQTTKLHPSNPKPGNTQKPKAVIAEDSKTTIPKPEPAQQPMPATVDDSKPAGPKPRVPDQPKPLSVDNIKPFVQGLSGVEAEQYAVALFNQGRYPEAKSYFDRACMQGKPDACDYIGRMYEEGLGVAHDGYLAATLYSKACDAGSADACTRLRSARHSGDVLRLSQECNGGNGDSCANLGGLYRAGMGVKRDPQKAMQLFEKACSMGSKLGCDDVKALQ